MTNATNTNIILDNSNYIIDETEQSFLLGRISGMTQEELGDEYRTYVERDINLHLVNAEQEIEDLPSRISEQHTIMQEAEVEYQLYRSLENWNTFEREMNKLKQLEAQLKSLNEFANNFNPDGDFEQLDRNEFGEDNTSTGKEIIEFLQLYADRISIDELATIFEAACLMKEKQEISWYHYLVIGIATSGRIARQTKKEAGWWDECDRLLKNKAKYQPRKEMPGLDDRFHGEMNIDMESAIDLMRKYRPIAQRFGIDVVAVAAGFEKE